MPHRWAYLERGYFWNSRGRAGGTTPEPPEKIWTAQFYPQLVLTAIPAKADTPRQRSGLGVWKLRSKLVKQFSFLSEQTFAIKRREGE